MNKVRFGIIATGGIAHKFARTAPLVEDMDLVAVASRSKDKAQEFADQYGLAKAYGSYQELFDDPDIDAVYIATPHNFHLENCTDAAKAGKHILCEKPLALTRADSEAIFAAAKENKVFCMEAMWTRFLPATIAARKWVESGVIGDVRLVTGMLGSYLPYDPKSRLYAPELAGGALYDLGVYNIEYALDFLKGQEVTKVWGTFDNNSVGTDMSTGLILQFDSGAQALLYCAFDINTDNTGHVYGTKGFVRLSPTFSAPKKVELFVDGELKETFESDFTSGFEYEIQHSIECIRAGKLESDTMSHRDTCLTAELFEQILK